RRGLRFIRSAFRLLEKGKASHPARSRRSARKGRVMERTASPTSLKVVVVEDDPTVRLFLKDALENQLGHQVVGEAETGTDMVRTVLALEPDVLVFDIHLPPMNPLP